MSSDEQKSPIPEVAGESERFKLSEADAILLTEARTASWKLEQNEYAYDFMVRTLTRCNTYLAFSGVLISILFVYLQNLVPASNTTQITWLGNLGTGLSLIVIFATIWSSMDHWTTRIEKMQTLSTLVRELLRDYKAVTTIRPVDHLKIQKWILKVIESEEKRKDPMANIWKIASQCGFQHVGNLHMKRSVVCPICSKEWAAESNRNLSISWLPFLSRGCFNCGVKMNEVKNN